MVTLLYHTHWQKAVLHYSDCEEWRDQEMAHTERNHWRTAQFKTLPLEFVVNDSWGHWDNPSQNCQLRRGNNYLISEPGRYALYRNDIVRVQASSKRVLLITDIDGTLLEENNGFATATTERFARFWLERHYFNGSKLVYSTGRSFDRFLSLYTTGLPVLDPDMLITSVGSEAYVMREDNGYFQLRTDYPDVFDKEHWDTEIVSQLLDSHFPWLIHPGRNANFQFKTWRTARIEDMAQHGNYLQYYMKNCENRVTYGKTIHCQVIISGQGSHQYLDFTPSNGGKRAGVDFCKRVFGFGKEQVLVAGDSGNDIAMFEGEEKGVIVANRQHELEHWYHHREGWKKNKYISWQSYADAIVEALS